MIRLKPILFMLVTAFFCFTDATYAMVEGGNCMTYDNTLPGSLIKFEACNFRDSRHNSWKFVTTASGLTLVCIGDTNMCDHVDSDGKKHLMKRDDSDVSQHWTGISGNRFTNGLTGPNMCAQAIHADGDKVQDYVLMKPCSDDRNQVFLTFSSTARLANYFRNSF